MLRVKTFGPSLGTPQNAIERSEVSPSTVLPAAGSETCCAPVGQANPYRRMAMALKTNSVADNLLHRQFEDYDPRMVLLTELSSSSPYFSML
jgi:hypothetical protein